MTIHSPAERTLTHFSTADVLRALLTYVLPLAAVLYVVVSGLWLVPDSFAGMYGNFDGHWASWSARGILEWGEFLDFSPVSPLSGTGSPFLPNLPWLNPGSLALAIPASLPVRHLASMLIYLAELSASLYWLYRHLEFSREQSFAATILYIAIFFIPLSGYTMALPWFSLAPINAHLIAAMNVATVALIRAGDERLALKLLFGLVFLAALFVAFASAPMTSLTYIPVYVALWIVFLIPFRVQLRAVLWRWGTIVFALLVLSLIGVPFYLAATVMTSARGDSAPPILHPGWRLLSPAYWQGLLSIFPICSNHMQLMCSVNHHRVVRNRGAGRGGMSRACRCRGEAALWPRHSGPARIASRLRSHERAAGSWPAACGKHAVSHVGLPSAGGSSGGCGRKHFIDKG